MLNTRVLFTTLLSICLASAPGAAKAANQSVQVLWEAASGALPDELQLPFDLTDTATPEEPVLAGGVLTLSTSEISEAMGYVQQGEAVMIPDHLVIKARLRYVSGSTATPARLPINISLATEPTIGNVFYVGHDQIFLLTSNTVAGPPAFVDTDNGFHDYRIEVIGASIVVYYDDVQVLTGSTFSDPNANGTLPRVAFGNGSIFAQGVSEWVSFEHNAGPPIGPATWNNAFAIQASGPVLNPSLLVGLQPVGGPVSAFSPDPSTIVLSYSGLESPELIQIDLANYGLPFYPPDPIKVVRGDRIEVEMDDNGTSFTLAIDLVSSTGELLDPGSVVGFNPQPEPPAALNYLFSPMPAGSPGALSILASLVGGAPKSGNTNISLTLQVLDALDVPLPLSLVPTATAIPEHAPNLGATSFALRSTPNPFNPSTRISFELPTAQHVALDIFAADGRRVARLVDSPMAAGDHSIPWHGLDSSGRSLASGTYFFRLASGGVSETGKVTLLK